MPRKAKEKVIENEIIDEKVTKAKSSTGTRKKAVKSDKKVDAKEKVVKESVDVIKPVKKATRKKKVDVEIIEETAIVSSEKKTKAPAKKKSTAKKKSEDAAEKKSAAKKKSESAAEKKSAAKKKAESAAEKKSTSSTKKKATLTDTKKATSSKKKSEETVDKKKTNTKITKTVETKNAEKATKTAKKATTTKKSTSLTKKTSSTTTRKKTKKTTEPEKTAIQIVEYYDLPYTYGNTMVKLLAQTPKTLFVYWEVSDLDIKNFKEQYGEDFFNITKPVLIVRNLTLNKTTEIEINDFANCWYLSTEDSDCKFDIELARKYIKDSNNTKLENNYLPIAKSNNLQVPNDHIMFEKLSNFITFTDTSTGETIKKNIKSFNFLKDLYKFYKDMYNDELLKNPSSNFNF